MTAQALYQPRNGQKSVEDPKPYRLQQEILEFHWRRRMRLWNCLRRRYDIVIGGGKPSDLSRRRPSLWQCARSAKHWR